MKIKAISLWQPWASLIAIGAKRFETRSWPTAYRGPLAIHAAKRWTNDEKNLCCKEPFWEALTEFCIGPPHGFDHDLPLGCIVAVAELRDCFEIGWQPEIGSNEYAFGDWRPGRFAWQLNDVRRLDTPIPWRGSQGFFEVELPLEPRPAPAQEELLK